MRYGFPSRSDKVQLNDDSNGEAFLGGGGSMAALIAQHDWATTELGPLSDWPASLKAILATLLSSGVPMALLYGEEGISIYNDAYTDFLGNRHPGILGGKARETWPEAAQLTDQALKVGLAGSSLALRDHELTLFRSGKPEQAWVNIDVSPVRDDNGRPVGVLSLVVETTQRVLAERKAALDLDQWRRLFDRAPGFIRITRGPHHVVEFANESYKRLVGERDMIGRSIRDVFADPDDGLLAVLDRVYATGERYVARGHQARLRLKPDGQPEDVILDMIMEPVLSDDGAVMGTFVEGFDVTEQVRARSAAQESERRLSVAIALARLGVFEWDEPTHEAILDARAREIFGFGPDERPTMPEVVSRIDADDLRTFFSDVMVTGEAQVGRHEFEYRVRHPDGSLRTVASVSDTAVASDGQVGRTIAVFDDVTERREAQRRQRLLINELNHRVKNTLATVQSIASQSLRSARDLPSGRAAFEARLFALSTAHNLLTEQSWHGASLTDVAKCAMAPFESTHRPQISSAGPPVWLSAPHALALSMALHELATNALRYGALSVPEGKVTLRWTAVGDELILSWREEGGPAVTPPERPGFGARLLQRNLARELGGEAALTFAPEGVHCEIRFTAAGKRTESLFDIDES